MMGIKKPDRVDWRKTADSYASRIRELEAELAALRQQQGEPVAWMQDTTAGLYVAEQRDQHHTVPLYREAAPRVPEGWKMVPEEPRWEMLKAAWHIDGNDDKHREIYIAMLAAAPEPKE